MRILRKAYVAILAVGYFATRNWDFKSDNFWDLLHNLLPEDRWVEFNISRDNIIIKFVCLTEMISTTT